MSVPKQAVLPPSQWGSSDDIIQIAVIREYVSKIVPDKGSHSNECMPSKVWEVAIIAVSAGWSQWPCSRLSYTSRKAQSLYVTHSLRWIWMGTKKRDSVHSPHWYTPWPSWSGHAAAEWKLLVVSAQNNVGSLLYCMQHLCKVVSQQTAPVAQGSCTSVKRFYTVSRTPGKNSNPLYTFYNVGFRKNYTSTVLHQIANKSPNFNRFCQCLHLLQWV